MYITETELTEYTLASTLNDKKRFAFISNRRYCLKRQFLIHWIKGLISWIKGLIQWIKGLIQQGLNNNSNLRRRTDSAQKIIIKKDEKQRLQSLYFQIKSILCKSFQKKNIFRDSSF